MSQKFFKGDLVKIADDLGRSMSHFPQGCEAVVIATYAEQYGGGGNDKYTLHVLKKGEGGENSWYYENQLTLIEPKRFDKLPKSSIHRKVWEAQQERDKNEASN